MWQSLKAWWTRTHCLKREARPDEARLIADGWNRYAQQWQPEQFAVLEGYHVRYLGDEWTAEDVTQNESTTYGLPPEIVRQFDHYLEQHVLNPYLPASAAEGMEIGPGGGRLTALLAPRTQLLHLVDASEAMLAHLRQRFGETPGLRYYHSDGKTLPVLAPASLDYVIAFDVFVHFEPRLVYWYVQQIARLLKPGGIGILHYANMLTPLGWQQFLRDVEPNLQTRQYFAAFGVMCPPVMAQFLTAFGLETLAADTRAIPRDAVAVFRKPL